MSAINVRATHRQCPRCRKANPLPAQICVGCGRRFQVPLPEPQFDLATGVYTGSPNSPLTPEVSGHGRGISAWWGPAFAALFVTPLGWVLLPLALALCILIAALSLTLFPTILAAIAVLKLHSARMQTIPRVFAISLLLVAGLGLNALLWHLVRHIMFG